MWWLWCVRHRAERGTVGVDRSEPALCKSLLFSLPSGLLRELIIQSSLTVFVPFSLAQVAFIPLVDLSRPMLSISSPIPSIRITPPPPEKNYPEPYSPIPPAMLDVEDDGYRPNRLMPPLLAAWHSSPLHPVDSPPDKGLGRDQFSSLLKLSRDQRAMLGSQEIPDLRKELALKSQSLKQRMCV